MRRDDICIYVSPSNRARLAALVVARCTSSKVVWRAKIVLATADGHGTGRIWAEAGLKPHLVRRFKLSNDPQLEEKVTDVVGLYMNPPDRALVLCVDEKSQIQALDRTQPGLPLKKGRAAMMTHNAETEHQTAKDTTKGWAKPMGTWGAKMADELGEARA